MLKSHEKFHSSNGKRQILIADDELINREMLKLILEDDYEIIETADGQQALEKITEYAETLSLILLDLMMPVMSGSELLVKLKNDSVLKHIPVIVLTGDQEAEVASLSSGASDFIPKPYPKAEVILARIRRTIELSEDRDIIQYTERDPLTGLYNKEFFYRYAEQFDQHHKDVAMDAIVVDIYHFHMINERFGTAYGDEVLKRIGEKLREAVSQSQGIVCRREADTFMLYCPHGLDYKEILDRAGMNFLNDDLEGNRVRLRMGVYSEVDKSLDIERRFDRAKIASDTVRNSLAKTIGLYDDRMHEKELYAEQLIEDFPKGIAEKQFLVYYQPKFDIRPDIPVMVSAEALVRWKHPSMGMINPGIFIPLFEENGLIQTLDHYVWDAAAEQVAEWKNRFGITVPVSVNVSRIDMYDPHLIDVLAGILSKYNLSAPDLHLEITESAYTQDSEQIISTVNRLRTLGFLVEMDDFGTGYSSLNMISSLPIDALKLDMQFIRNAFKDKKDTRMLEVIIDIADYLGVPVIAEGVETEEQLNSLRAMGCDIVQGYYFSRPIPSDEYEHFVVERQNMKLDHEIQFDKTGSHEQDNSFSRIAYALSSGFELVYYVDLRDNHYVQFSSDGRYEDLQITRSGGDFFENIQRRIIKYVFPEDRKRLSSCLQKNALLAQMYDNKPFSLTFRVLVKESTEYYNLKIVKAKTVDNHHIVVGISKIQPDIAEAAGSADEQGISVYSRIAHALARDYFCIYYVNTDTDHFIEYSSDDAFAQFGLEKEGDDFFNLSRENIRRIGYSEDIADFLSAFTKENILEAKKTSGVFTLTYRLMFDNVPTYVHLKATCMDDQNDPHIVIGVSNINEQMMREQEHAYVLHTARELANRDPLTGVKSKRAFIDAEESFNQSIANQDCKPFAVAVMDVNELKKINDTQGHVAGDELIRSASMEICNIFSHSPVYRYGGDEFVVIMRGRDYDNRKMLMDLLKAENRTHSVYGGAVIACGISDYVPGEDTKFSDVFVRADAQMYENKNLLKQQGPFPGTM